MPRIPIESLQPGASVSKQVFLLRDKSLSPTRSGVSLMRLVLGELSQLVLQGQFVIPRRLTALGFAFRFPDLPTTLADLL